MKCALILLASCMIAAAQTGAGPFDKYLDHTNSPGWLPTNGPIFISFTNSMGRFITNAEVVRIFPNKVFYKTDFGGGSVRIENLSSNVQDEPGYDRTNAVVQDLIEGIERAQVDIKGSQSVAQAKARLRWEQLEESVYATRREWYADIVQKIDDGLLVDIPSRMFGETDQTLILLKNYHAQNSVAADDTIHFLGFPTGIYTYTTVKGSENSVHVYDCNLDSAATYFTTNLAQLSLTASRP
jgi:hypothetical protein